MKKFFLLFLMFWALVATARAQVSAITILGMPTPGCGVVGNSMTVTFSITDAGNYGTVNYDILFSPASSPTTAAFSSYLGRNMVCSNSDAGYYFYDQGIPTNTVIKTVPVPSGSYSYLIVIAQENTVYLSCSNPTTYTSFVIPCNTATPTVTATLTPTSTTTNTFTVTPTNTTTNTFTVTPTATFTRTFTNTRTPTATRTFTNTTTNTATFTTTVTVTNTATSTATGTPTNTFTRTNTWTITRTNTPTNTPTNTFTRTNTWTNTATSTTTNTATRTFTNTTTNTATPTPTNTFATFTFTPTPNGTRVIPFYDGSNTKNLYNSTTNAFTSASAFFGKLQYAEVDNEGIEVHLTVPSNSLYISSSFLNLDSTSNPIYFNSTLGGVFFGVVNMNNHPVTNMSDPTNAQDAATKNYVDTRVYSGFVTFSNALTTPVTVTITGATATSRVVFGERGTALASSFGYTASTNQVIFNGTFAGAATVAYVLIP